MSARHYHKRYHSDALAGMMALTLEERGAYQTLLDMMYDRGGPLQDNERLLAGYMGCSVRKWRSLRETLIQKGKIEVNGAGELTNRRAELELENQLKTSRKHAENGLNGSRKKAESAKKTNEINESDQAGLKQGFSHTRYQIPDRIANNSVSSLSGARATEPEPAAGEIETQCRKIAEAIHLTRPIAEVDRVQVRQWLRDGLSFDWHVMPAVAAVAAREIDRGRSISGFRYLDGAVRDYAGEWQREHDRLQAIAGGGR